MRKELRLFTLLAMVPLFAACPESVPSTGHIVEVSNPVVATGVGFPDNGDPDVQVPAPLATCTPQLLWEQHPGYYDFIYGDAELALSPNGQLALLQSGLSRQYVNLRDGSLLGRDTASLQGLPDSQWQTDLLVRESTLDLVTYPEGETVLTVTPPAPSDPAFEWLSLLMGTLSPAGDQVASVACWRAPGVEDSEVAVTVFETDGGTVLTHVTLNEECSGNNWLDKPRLLFAANHNLLVHMPGSGRVHLVDSQIGQHASVDVVGDVQPIDSVTGTPPAYVPVLSPVADLALNTAGTQLAAVLHDGSLRFFDLPDLEEIGPEIAAGFAGINLYTYGPSTAAPVVWSNDGMLVAHMSPEGELALSVTSTGVTVRTLPNPVADSGGAAEGFLNPPVAMRFVNGDSGLLVVHEMGWRLWSCAVPFWPAVTEVEVGLQGPDAIPESTPATLFFDYEEIAGPVVHAVLTKDVLIPTASLANTLQEHLYGDGTQSVVGRIHSGTRSGTSEPLTIQVLPGRW